MAVDVSRQIPLRSAQLACAKERPKTRDAKHQFNDANSADE
jgi:hypothetical protein